MLELIFITFSTKSHLWSVVRQSFVLCLQTRKIRSIFALKDQNKHKSNAVYQGKCSCGEVYIGKTMRNLGIRIAEHSNTRHNSEPARHLLANLKHIFTRKVLLSAKSNFTRKILKGPVTKRKNPSLNKQVKCFTLPDCFL